MNGRWEEGHEEDEEDESFPRRSGNGFTVEDA
jgi:hypothetical protein